MIVFEPKIWKQTYISNENNTGWRCNSCSTGVLKLVENVVTSHRQMAVDLVCSHPKCKMNYSMVGKTAFMAGSTKVSSVYYKIDDIRIYPTHFQPPLEFFKIPQEINEQVSSLFRLSFSHYWIDKDACLNKIRQALEIMIKSKGAKGKNLHSQIESIRISLTENIANSLLALKWLGNQGSHSGGDFNRDHVLEAYEILVAVLNQLYPDTRRENELRNKVANINSNKGLKQ